MRLSAKRLGEKIGLTAEEMNTLLKEEGYIEGKTGEYVITEKGKIYSEEKGWDNGEGGYAARSYEYNVYDENILDKINLTDEYKEKIRELTKQNRHQRKLEREQRYKEYMEKNSYTPNIEPETKIEDINWLKILIVVLCTLLVIPPIVKFIKWFKNKMQARKQKNLPNNQETKK